MGNKGTCPSAVYNLEEPTPYLTFQKLFSTFPTFYKNNGRHCCCRGVGRAKGQNWGSRKRKQLLKKGNRGRGTDSHWGGHTHKRQRDERVPPEGTKLIRIKSQLSSAPWLPPKCGSWPALFYAAYSILPSSGSLASQWHCVQRTEWLASERRGLWVGQRSFIHCDTASSTLHCHIPCFHLQVKRAQQGFCSPQVPTDDECELVPKSIING